MNAIYIKLAVIVAIVSIGVTIAVTIESPFAIGLSAVLAAMAVAGLSE